MRRQHPRCVQERGPADGVEQVRGQRQVEHLLDEDAPHQLDGFGVALRVERVERAQVRRQGRVLQFDRPLQMLAEIVDRGDPCGRDGNGGMLPPGRVVHGFLASDVVR
jgi:hypothetical protein